MPYRRTIMVVEDDQDIRELTAAALRDEGYRVVAVEHHADALTQLGAFRFGLILADSEGGIGDPWARLLELREAAGQAPVVIYSAHRAEMFADYAERGFAGFLAKPFNLEELLGAVREHVPTPETPPASGSASRTA